MPRGGKRKPPARTPPSGPGQFSRRTDGQQVEAGTLGGPERGESSLQFGDVQRLEAAQTIAPLPVGTRPPRSAPPERRPAGTPPSGGRLAPHLLTMEPEATEPTTTGLDVGPGAGSEVLSARVPSPDIRESVLEHLWLRYRNNDAFQLLNKLRAERSSLAPPAATAPGAPVEPEEPAVLTP